MTYPSIPPATGSTLHCGELPVSIFTELSPSKEEITEIQETDDTNDRYQRTCLCHIKVINSSAVLSVKVERPWPAQGHLI